MRRVRSKDTTPEITVRRILHRLGYRYRLHASDVPGKPDIVNRRRMQAVFVHGCFWHGHDCKRGNRIPSTNTDYWLAKIGRNMDRDAANQCLLKEQGWSVLIVWECELKDTEQLSEKLASFIGPPTEKS